MIVQDDVTGKRRGLLLLGVGIPRSRLLPAPVNDPCKAHAISKTSFSAQNTTVCSLWISMVSVSYPTDSLGVCSKLWTCWEREASCCFNRWSWSHGRKAVRFRLPRKDNEILTLWFIRYDTQDGLYGIAWSELNDNHIASASGDGSIKLWDLNINVSELSTSSNQAY